MNDTQWVGAKVALEQAIRRAGSETELARMLGATERDFNQQRRGRNAFLTAEQAVIVEEKLSIPRATSRPDLFEGIIPAEWDDGQFPIYAGDNLSLEPWGNLQSETVDLTRTFRRSPRPPHIPRDRGLYGLIIATTTMRPRFKPGSLVIAERNAPPSIGDDVMVLRLVGTATEVVIAQLYAQEADSITLLQYEAGEWLKTGVEEFDAVNRILTIDDLVQHAAAVMD